MAPPRDLRDPPPSLARERTELAWSRTVIAFAAVGGALLKENVAAGVTVVGMGVLIWGLVRTFPAAGVGGTSRGRLRLVAISVAAVAAVALAVAMLAHGSSRGLTRPAAPSRAASHSAAGAPGRQGPGSPPGPP